MAISLNEYAQLEEKVDRVDFTLSPAKRETFVAVLNKMFPEAYLPKQREQGVVLRVFNDEPKGNATIWNSGAAQVTGAMVYLEWDFGK